MKDHEIGKHERLTPINPFSASKAAAEQYIYAYNKCFDEKVQIVRPPVNYGPYQAHTKVIARTILSCLNKEKFRIFNEAKPAPRRWWVHVQDTCRAVDMIVKKGGEHEIYDIVTPDKMTVSEAVNRILELTGNQNLFDGYMEARLNDIESYSLDGSALNALGWKPAHSFDDGIRNTIEWYSKNAGWFCETVI